MVFEVDVALRRGDRLVRASFNSDARVTALFAPSGAGKTSVLDMVAGLLRPDSGRIAIADEVLFDDHTGIDVPPQHRRSGYVFQDRRLFPHLRVGANLRYGARAALAEQRLIEIEEITGLLGIAHLLDRWPRTLSGGEAQRVAIGRALLAAPRVLLLDEPLAALDRARRDELIQLIERIRDALAVPILYVSHDRAEVERLAGRIVPIEPLG